MDRELFFTNVYKNNQWNGKISRSGTGSEFAFATQKIDLIQDIINEYNIQSIVDIGCGDLHWMKTILDKNKIIYTGLDVVEPLLHTNKINNPDQRFEKIDFDNNYTADLVIVFDVFGHQLHNEVIEMINYINKLDVKYILVTNRINADTNYCNIKKTRHEGINVERYHNWNKTLLEKKPALYPDDFFCLYTCHTKV